MIRGNVFSAKLWFVKTLARIVKYKSRVVKSNLDDILKMIVEIEKNNEKWPKKCCLGNGKVKHVLLYYFLIN